MIANSSPWDNLKFDKEGVREVARKLFATLYNTYSFFALYANVDSFSGAEKQIPVNERPEIDRWILSLLNTLTKDVDEALSDYEPTKAARAINIFVNDNLSNWYVRRSRERFWVKGMPQDKINAYMTLYTTLVTFCKLAAPMIPFMTEDIYRNIVVRTDSAAPESIHLCDYPKADASLIDTALEERMEDVLKIVVLGRACRNTANIKNRQPLGKMFVKADFTLPPFYTQIIAEELNVKEVLFTDDVRAFTTYTFKPQLKTLGPKFGKQLNTVRTILSALDGNKAMDELNASGTLRITVDGSDALLTREDLLIESAQAEGYESCADNGITVVIDTKLSQALIEEGYVREIISKIQTMRKDAGFEVMDHIRVYAAGNEKIRRTMEQNSAEIKSEVLAEELSFDTAEGFEKEWNLNGEQVTFSVKKI